MVAPQKPLHHLHIQWGVGSVGHTSQEVLAQKIGAHVLQALPSGPTKLIRSMEITLFRPEHGLACKLYLAPTIGQSGRIHAFYQPPNAVLIWQEDQSIGSVAIQGDNRDTLPLEIARAIIAGLRVCLIEYMESLREVLAECSAIEVAALGASHLTSVKVSEPFIERIGGVKRAQHIGILQHPSQISSL